MNKIKKGPGRPRKIPKIEESQNNYKIRWSYPSANRISVKCMWEGKGSLNTDFLDCETSPVFIAGIDDELKWQIKVTRLNEFLEDYPFMVVVQFLKNIKHNCKISIRTRGSLQTVLKAFDDTDNNLECDGVGFNPNEFWDYSTSSQNYIFDIEILADSSKGLKPPQIDDCKNVILLPEPKPDPKFDTEEKSKEIFKLEPKFGTEEKSKDTFKLDPKFDTEKKSKEIFKPDPKVDKPELKQDDVLNLSEDKIERMPGIDCETQNSKIEILNLEEMEIAKFTSGIPYYGFEDIPNSDKKNQDPTIEIPKLEKQEPEMEIPKLEKQEPETEIPKLEKIDILRLTNVKMYVSRTKNHFSGIKKISSSQKKPNVEVVREQSQKQIVDVKNKISEPKPSFVENSKDFPMNVSQYRDKEQAGTSKMVVSNFQNHVKDVEMENLQDTDEKQTVIVEEETVPDLKTHKDSEIKILKDRCSEKPTQIKNSDIFMSDQNFKILEIELLKKNDQDCRQSEISAQKGDQEEKVINKEEFETTVSRSSDMILKTSLAEKNAENPVEEVCDVNNRKEDMEVENTELSSIPGQIEEPSNFEARSAVEDQEQKPRQDFEMLEINSTQLTILPELQDFANMVNDVSYVDAFVIIEGKKIAAHKCILACRSPFFKDKFSPSKSEINIENGVTYETMKKVLIFMYTGCIYENEPRNLAQMFDAAKSLDIPALRTKLEEVFNQMINERNAMELFLLADEIQCETLKSCVAKFMI